MKIVNSGPVSLKLSRRERSMLADVAEECRDLSFRNHHNCPTPESCWNGRTMASWAELEGFCEKLEELLRE